MSGGFRVARIEAHAFRQPVAEPVRTSFGVMRDRPAVFVRLEDRDGAHGWGEVFANWPASGAEHRCRLIAEDLADLVVGGRFEGPEDLFDRLTAATRIRALQCGEPGPFAQCIAGLDVAAWDLSARRAGLPLRTHLAAGAPDAVATYASGIPVDRAADTIGRARAAGFDACKVKVGFDAAVEPGLLAALRDGPAAGIALMADANQAWTEAEAARFLAATEGIGLDWLEEPMIATAPAAVWRRLAGATRTPLAGGENLGAADAFARAVAAGHLRVIQPDVAKWGGITGCRRVARRALAAGLLYCPHFLGGGVGLAASAHLLAAVGGGGRLEVDVNPNALRDAFGAVEDRLDAGRLALGRAPGLGIEALPEAILPLRTAQATVTAADR